MSAFRRPDSPFWWLWLETAAPGLKREKTSITVGRTTAQRQASRVLAENLYHKRMNEIAARVHHLPTDLAALRFDKYAAAYEAHTIAHHAGAERERELLKQLRAGLVNSRGTSELLTAIDRDRVQRYLTARVAAQVSPRTANREIDLLKAMLRDAVPKYLDASPLVGMKRLRTVAPKRRLLAPAEERRLLAHATPMERALVLVGLDGLVRAGDILDIQRTDRRGAWLYIGDPKNGQPYEAALTPRVVTALQRLEREMPVDQRFYFQRYRVARTARDRRGRVRQIFMALCARADVPYGRAIGGVTFHWATRRTGATRLLVDRKKPLPAVQAQGNWKSPEMLLQVYAEASRRQQRAAVLPPRSRRTRKRA